MKKKGQGAIIGALFAFVLVALMAILQGPLIEFVELGVNQTSNETANSALIITVIQLLPVIFWLVVLIAVVALITQSGR